MTISSSRPNTTTAFERDVQAIVRGVPTALKYTNIILVRFPDVEEREDVEDRGEDVRTRIGRLSPSSIADLKLTPRKAVCTIALTHAGLRRVGLSKPLLEAFDPAFREGMQRRASLLGDDHESDPRSWDAQWREGPFHLMVMLHHETPGALRQRTEEVLQDLDVKPQDYEILRCVRLEVTSESPKVCLGGGVEPSRGSLIEHFGFNDAATSTSVKRIDERWPEGNGKFDGKTWTPLETGEFLLGHVDETGEKAKAPDASLAINSTYLVYRKLEQDVEGFRAFVREHAETHQIDADLFAEKMVGRTRNGDPLSLSAQDSTTPHREARRPHLWYHRFGRKLRSWIRLVRRLLVSGFRRRRKPAAHRKDPPARNDFKFDDDLDGLGCPLGSHIRRANPRATMGFGTTLVDRHRILRRSFPYGTLYDEKAASEEEGGRGLAFIALNADIQRQFEFIQQQWINFGDALEQGEDRDPIVGSQRKRDGKYIGRLVMPRMTTEQGERTVICHEIPSFVHTRGGDYFFLPGIRAFDSIVAGEFS